MGRTPRQAFNVRFLAVWRLQANAFIGNLLDAFGEIWEDRPERANKISRLISATSFHVYRSWLRLDWRIAC